VYLKINTAGWTPDVYSVHIWANDSTAHINHSIFTFTVGNTAPNTSIESIVPNPAKYGLENVSVEWIATDFNMDANYTNVSYPNGSILATYYQNFTLETSNLTQVGNYSILVWAKDELGMVNWTLDTLIVYNYTPPTIALISPADSYWFNENNVTFFFRPEDDEDIVNCTVIIDNELNQSNTSAIIRNVTNNITTSIGDGTYTWTVNCTDNNSYVGTNTSTRTLNIDTSSIIVNSVSPANNTLDLDGYTYFVYDVSALGSPISNCSLVFNNQVNTTNFTVSAGYNNFSIESMADGSYNWSVNCTDDAANVGISEIRNLTVSVHPEMYLNVTADDTSYFVGEIVQIRTNATDFYSNPMDTSVTTVIINKQTRMPWWNTSFSYRQAINITNSYASAIPENFTVNVTFNMQTLEAAGKAQADGDDIRIAWWNNATNSWQELDRINITPWNSSATTVYFRTQEPIPSVDERYYIYYGNSTVSNPPSDQSNIYDFYDDFSSDTGAWHEESSTGRWSISGGIATNTNPSGDYNSYVVKDRNYTDFEMIVEYRVNSGVSHGGLNFRGQNSAADYGYQEIFRPTTTNAARIQLRNPDQSYPIAQQDLPQPFNRDTWYTVKLKAVGTNITTTFNGTVDMNEDMSSSYYTIGKSGFQGYDGTQDFDNYRIRLIHEDADVSLTQEEQSVDDNRGQTGVLGTLLWQWNSSGQDQGSYTAISYSQKDNYDSAFASVFFQLNKDVTSPNITLYSPENNTWSTVPTVIFNYTVNDAVSAIDNCSCRSPVCRRILGSRNFRWYSSCLTYLRSCLLCR